MATDRDQRIVKLTSQILQCGLGEDFAETLHALCDAAAFLTHRFAKDRGERDRFAAEFMVQLRVHWAEYDRAEVAMRGEKNHE